MMMIMIMIITTITAARTPGAETTNTKTTTTATKTTTTNIITTKTSTMKTTTTNATLKYIYLCTHICFGIGDTIRTLQDIEWSALCGTFNREKSAKNHHNWSKPTPLLSLWLMHAAKP